MLKLLEETNIEEKNRIILLRQWLIATADGEEHIRTILDWINGTHGRLRRIELGLKDKWEIVKFINRSPVVSDTERSVYFEKVAQIDPSDAKVLAKKVCEALSIQGDERRSLWERYLIGEAKDSVKMIGESMSGFNDISRLEELKEFHEEFFDNLIKVFQTRPREYSKEFYKRLFPCGDDLGHQILRAKEVLEECPVQQETLRKLLVESIDNLERRLKAFNCLYLSLKQ